MKTRIRLRNSRKIDGSNDFWSCVILLLEENRICERNFYICYEACTKFKQNSASRGNSVAKCQKWQVPRGKTMYSPRFIRITSGSADEILYVETGSIRAISSVVNVTMVSTWFAILDSSFFFFFSASQLCNNTL